MKKIKEMLQDTNGKLSFKRVTALASYIVGLILSIVLFIYTLNKGVEDADTAILLISLLTGTATATGISTVFEKAKKEKEID